MKEKQRVRHLAIAYFNKTLFIGFITSDGISIASFATVIGAPFGINKRKS